MRNEVFKPGWNLSVICSHPASPVSGGPVRVGKLTGVAETNEGDGGNAATNTSVYFGPGVFDLTVDDNEGSGIAVGDTIYYHDTGTGTGEVNLNNSATSMDAVFGVALETVAPNATTAIRVMHIPVGSTTALGSGVAGTGQIADGAVTPAKLAAGDSDGLHVLRAARFTFDPSADSDMRSIGAHGLGVTLPDNALVLGGGVEILTTFASAGADAGTIALSIQGANDLITATAISSGTFWDAVAYKGIVPTALELTGVATAIKLSAAREVTATVAAQALTAGKLVGWLFYVVGD